MKKFIPALIVFVLLSGICKGQDKCATMDYLKYLISQDPSIEQKMQDFEAQLQNDITDQNSQLKSTNGVITIPVVFHILYNSEAQNIPDLRAYEQMEALNRDYTGKTNHGTIKPFDTLLKANCGIQFCLAKQDPSGKFTTGIERREVTVSTFTANNDMKFLSRGGLDAWDPKKYMNVWVCELDNYIAGYAQFPGSGINNTYGVVINYLCFGYTAASQFHNLGATTTHELGHCFNLRHIWGDDGTDCSGTDYCDDTPNQAGYTMIPRCVDGIMTDACAPNFPGIMYMNFMDYSYDVYKTNFTPDQNARIQPLFNQKKGALYSLTQSNAGVPPAVICKAPVNLSESQIGETTAILNWDAPSSAVSYSVQYMVAGASLWTSISTSNNSIALAGLKPATDYIWRVQTLCSANVSSGYSDILSFLTGGIPTCINSFEPNETRTASAQIATNVLVSAGVASATDQDWYKFSNSQQQKNIQVLLSDLPADYDIKLYNSTGVQIGVSQNTGTSDEKIIYNNGSKGIYYIEVYSTGAFSTNLCYTLKASISSTSYTAMSEGYVDNERNTPLLFQVYPNPAKNIVNVDYNAATGGILEAKFYTLIGTPITFERHTFIKGLNSYQLDISHMKKGMYLLNLSDGSENEVVKVMVE